MEGKRKVSILNIALIIMLVLCLAMGTAIILLSSSKTQIEIAERSGDKNNATAEETSETNTWDISATENDNVIATLSDDGTLTICGIGRMKCYTWNENSAPWMAVEEKIKKVKIEEGVTNIGGGFNNCNNLEDIELANTVTTIEPYAIAYTEISSIKIPSSVTMISENAFIYSELIEIKVDNNNTSYCDVEGVLYSKDKRELVNYPRFRPDKKYSILSDTTKIWTNAFKCVPYIETVEIPEGLTTIGEDTFSGCWGLKEINIPSTVTTIGNSAFSNCLRLKDVDIPFSATENLGQTMFAGSLITNFINQGTTTIEMPNILKMAQNANDEIIFTNCSIENDKIKIEDSKTCACIDIETGVFKDFRYVISYTSWDVSIEGDNSLIAKLNDEDYSLTIYGIGDMRIYSEEVLWQSFRMFIEHIVIEEGVRSIDLSDFTNYMFLEDITIPSSVLNLKNDDNGLEILSQCYLLENIKVDDKNTKYCDYNGVLYTKSMDEIIKYPDGKMETEYRIPNTVKKIGDYAFNGSMYRKEILIPKTVTSIGEKAIYFDNIWCYKDSTAHTYAQKNKLNYLLIMDEIQPKTTAQQIKEKIGTENEYKILDENGNEIADTEIVVTGYTAQTDSGENYMLTIKGDCNGDGKADTRDILEINKHRLNKVSLTMEYSLAGDVNGNGQVDTKDILQINKFRLGKINEL